MQGWETDIQERTGGSFLQLPLYHSLLVDHHGEPDHRLHGRRHDQAGIGRCGEAKVCVSDALYLEGRLLSVDDRIPVDGLREELAERSFITFPVDSVESQYESNEPTQECHELHEEKRRPSR